MKEWEAEDAAAAALSKDSERGLEVVEEGVEPSAKA
jgi:hypothetical protein